MNVKALILLGIALVICDRSVHAQSRAEVSVPELSLTPRGIQISYHILNSLETEFFTIRIEVTTAGGEFIDANTLSGDIGTRIPGGRDKKIFWDMVADSIYLAEEIFVQVIASPELAVDLEQQSTINEIEQTNDKSFSRSSLILQSLVFPGLGLSRIHAGKPHWIKGVVGYGCIGTAIYLNREALKNYNAYLNPDNINDIDELFTKAEQQDQISEILAFVAAGIWVTDLIWTILGTSEGKLASSAAKLNRISIEPKIEPLSAIPMVGVRYRF